MSGRPELVHLSGCLGTLDSSSGVVQVARRLAEVVIAMEPEDVRAVTALMSRAAELGADVRRLAALYRTDVSSDGRGAPSKGAGT
ncbi:hypothetical protein [Archangium violaceum]|uniref:Uncharacterized protein n=1 Tax=Archangium violaceum Cb vi76 TaxID=1406225 RepID=A0A084SE06_9BACT|nr:hypothetical protein [Archangium violaceum]KFA86691.1 hypothetical protein Q664_52710 [Archangium violaceum Cb vi76]